MAGGGDGGAKLRWVAVGERREGVLLVSMETQRIRGRNEALQGKNEIGEVEEKVRESKKERDGGMLMD